MSNEKKGQLIDAINDGVSMWVGEQTHLCINTEPETLRKFLKEYVRDDDEVIDHNIEYFEINCPIDFLDTKSIIENDNDYVPLIDGWHLNVNWIFECNYDELIEDGVLIEL